MTAHGTQRTAHPMAFFDPTDNHGWPRWPPLCMRTAPPGPPIKNVAKSGLPARICGGWRSDDLWQQTAVGVSPSGPLRRPEFSKGSSPATCPSSSQTAKALGLAVSSYGTSLRCLSSGRHLRRANSQGRKACRSPGPAGDRVRDGGQSQSRQSTRCAIPTAILLRADEVIG
jgi:hypothetical protein